MEHSPQTLMGLCGDNDFDACYALRSDSDVHRRGYALLHACEIGFKDTCRIYHDWKIEDPAVVPQGLAYSAAVDGCLKSKDVSLCKDALAFEARDPERFTPMIDRSRAQIDQVLAGASTSPKDP